MTRHAGAFAVGGIRWCLQSRSGGRAAVMKLLVFSQIWLHIFADLAGVSRPGSRSSS